MDPAEVKRVEVEEARRKLDSATAILVCAYEPDEKFREFPLEGAQPLSRFRAREKEISKDQEIILYCA